MDLWRIAALRLWRLSTLAADRFSACFGALLHCDPVAEEHRSWSKAKAESDLFVLVNQSLRRQLLQQRLRLLQIKRVKALGEPAVDRTDEFARLLHLALVASEAHH